MQRKSTSSLRFVQLLYYVTLQMLWIIKKMYLKRHPDKIKIKNQNTCNKGMWMTLMVDH